MLVYAIYMKAIKILIILEDCCTKDLSERVNHMSVWLLDTSFNRRIANHIWEDDNYLVGLDTGLSLIDPKSNSDKASDFLQALDMLDDEYSLPWSELEIWGLDLQGLHEQITAKLGKVMIGEFETGGFIIRNSIPQPIHSSYLNI